MSNREVINSDKILKQTEEYIVYQRDGDNFFISKTAKAGGGRIEGLLIKKAKNKIT